MQLLPNALSNMLCLIAVIKIPKEIFELANVSFTGGGVVLPTSISSTGVRKIKIASPGTSVGVPVQVLLGIIII